ncbi:hypothetical protein [Archangium sp.]|uniref:hypothetical protein n=1 Tax=Archangium sp. TaxID=1872627 RepID=UPI00389A9D2E
MLLVLDSSALDSSLKVEQLLGKPGKGGVAEVRGPLVAREEGTPLAALRDGDKLHVVAPGDGATVAGCSPEQLVQRLGALGLARGVRLKQLHLIADDSGTGGDASFAARFAEVLAAEGYAVPEIKAPRGRVRSAPDGKVLVRPSEAPLDGGDAEGFRPSDSSLNHYAGAGVQEKHRR